MASQRVRVHNQILSMLKAGPYYAVTYDGADNEANDIGASPQLYTPVSARTNEVGSQFETDRQYKRDYVLDRIGWTWVGIVKFNREVTAYPAEEAWSTNPPVLPRTDELRQARIELESVSYQHPTQQQGHGGTVIEFTFKVRLGRR